MGYSGQEDILSQNNSLSLHSVNVLPVFPVSIIQIPPGERWSSQGALPKELILKFYEDISRNWLWLQQQLFDVVSTAHEIEFPVSWASPLAPHANTAALVGKAICSVNNSHFKITLFIVQLLYWCHVSCSVSYLHIYSSQVKRGIGKCCFFPLIKHGLNLSHNSQWSQCLLLGTQTVLSMTHGLL